MPVHIVERLQKMNKAERILWTQLGREPTLAEIAEEASLPIDQAREVRAAARASTSLDQPVGEQEDAVFGDFVAGDGPSPEDEVEVSLRSQALLRGLAALSDRERKVLALRYGLGEAEPKTLEEIGRRLGLTRERVRQIEVHALRRLSKLREMESSRAPRPSADPSKKRTASSPRPLADLLVGLVEVRRSSRAMAVRRHERSLAVLQKAPRELLGARPMQSEQARSVHLQGPAAAGQLLRHSRIVQDGLGALRVSDDGPKPAGLDVLPHSEENLWPAGERDLDEHATSAVELVAGHVLAQSRGCGVNSNPSRNSRPACGCISPYALRMATSRSASERQVRPDVRCPKEDRRTVGSRLTTELDALAHGRSAVVAGWDDMRVAVDEKGPVLHAVQGTDRHSCHRGGASYVSSR